ncbi:MAG: hypothetical protein PHN56_05615 [Candidatus Nanoarchaeia archaeon]|nr:hypothetical protein [Candidatus Nanoarchaeia archaeon]
MEKAEMFEKIAEVFDIKSVDDLVYKMPFITTHDIQCFGFFREGLSEYKNINPKNTYLAVYEKIKNFEKSKFSKYFQGDFKSEHFGVPFSTEDYTPLAITCHHQAQFLKDFINEYLSKKDNSLIENNNLSGLEGVIKEQVQQICSNKATIVHVKIYTNGKLNYGHYIVGYKGKLLECSNNIKIIKDVANVPWNNDSFNVEKIKEKNGKNYLIIGVNFPVYEEWLTWKDNISQEERIKANLVLKEWKEKRI